MSEKRFKFEKECTENFFTEKGVFYNNERPMSVNEIITLLNSLYNENEQLKKADKLNEKFATEMIERLQKENEQLRENLYNCRLNKNIISEKLKLWQDVHKKYNIYSIKDFEKLMKKVK